MDHKRNKRADEAAKTGADCRQTKQWFPTVQKHIQRGHNLRATSNRAQLSEETLSIDGRRRVLAFLLGG